METVMNGNGHRTDLILRQPLLSQFSEATLIVRPTVRQALSKWYRSLKTGNYQKEADNNLRI